MWSALSPSNLFIMYITLLIAVLQSLLVCYTTFSFPSFSTLLSQCARIVLLSLSSSSSPPANLCQRLEANRSTALGEAMCACRTQTTSKGQTFCLWRGGGGTFLPQRRTVMLRNKKKKQVELSFLLNNTNKRENVESLVKELWMIEGLK